MQGQYLSFLRYVVALIFLVGMISSNFAIAAETHQKSEHHSSSKHVNNQHLASKHLSLHTKKNIEKSSKAHSTHQVRASKHHHKPHHLKLHHLAAVRTHLISHQRAIPASVSDARLVDLSQEDSTTEPANKGVEAAQTPSADFDRPIGQRLVSFVHAAIVSLRYSSYRWGDRVFDTAHGVYELDCSHYVDHVLQRVCPSAYSSLVSSTGTPSPSSANYYAFFSRLSSDIEQSWHKVESAKELQAGDILVFRYLSRSGMVDGGHVMVVMNKPVTDNNTLLVRVSDSASAGHSDDTRLPHRSGVGIGTLLLKVNTDNGQPSAYAWGLGAPWQNRVNIAMARPTDSESHEVV